MVPSQSSFFLFYYIVFGVNADVMQQGISTLTTHHVPHHISLAMTKPINRLSKRHIKREHDAGLTSEEKSVLLNLHNNLRATVGSSDMTRMRWNFGLAKTAQAYAEECKFEYTSFEFRKNLSDLGYVGENLYIGTGRLNVTLAATMWWEEIQFYDYDTAHCQTNHKCGHYTQMAWADSYALGCGFKYCHTLRNVPSNDFESGNNLVCHYAPGGNYRYAKPFKKGPACSQCPSTMKFCVDHLCGFFIFYCLAGCAVCALVHALPAAIQRRSVEALGKNVDYSSEGTSKHVKHLTKPLFINHCHCLN